MKLNFLGSGNFFTEQNFHSNLLLQHNGHGLLIDAGSDLRHSLKAAGHSLADIDTVYISHLHDDHCGGLEWLGFASRFITHKKLRLVMHMDVFQYLWPLRLAASMGNLVYGCEMHQMCLNDYFYVDPVEEDFFWEDVQLNLVRVPHVMDSFGLWLPKEGIYFTSDCADAYTHPAGNIYPKRVADIYEQSKMIFHDCEVSPRRSCVHANFEQQLSQMPSEIKAKTWLYHLHDGATLPDNHGFAGIVAQGQEFEI
jgi:glyoxylase-like metal-dependent hydrolase (beta-lactamase superfamily II)